ncbi:unnamed protein product [Rhizoctonia solani]|uniref:Uncharacterized protein n=1 Tax=Rhizoctonia solani TaxID=456999 RepID=A0A8H2XM26_9AGAM|nr:unnamed protein product [Rhizoctonia solani]CAE6501844.1 unnamed protein product [Rhizoctonia solani]
MSARLALLILCAATYVQAASSVDTKAKIILACLLGGVPAISLIMLTVFCIWIKQRKRRAQKDALANGIELGPDGWPAKTATHTVVLPTVGALPGNASTASGIVGDRTDAHGTVPPPAYEVGDGKKGTAPSW